MGHTIKQRLLLYTFIDILAWEPGAAQVTHS